MSGLAEGVVFNLSLLYTPWLYQGGLGALKAAGVAGPEALLPFTKHGFYFEDSSTASEICPLSRSHFSGFWGVGTGVMRKGIAQEASDRAYSASC